MTMDGLKNHSTNREGPRQSTRAFVITCHIANISTVALIDTGASSNFVSLKFIRELMSQGVGITIQKSNLILKLANQQTISTAGYLELTMQIQTTEIYVPLFIVETLAYPIILGCEFLRKERLILRFDRGIDELIMTEVAQINTLHSNPGMCLLNSIKIPAYRQVWVECCVTSPVTADREYSIEPSSNLLVERGILVARGIIKMGRHNLIAKLANISATEVTLNALQEIASIEGIDNTFQIEHLTVIDENPDPNEPEIRENQAGDERSRNDLIESIKVAIPKLNISFEQFNDEELKSITNTLVRNKDLFDITIHKYGLSKGVQHTIDTGQARPVCQPPHRVSPKERQLIREMTDDMLQNGVIRPSVSPWASPIVSVKKKEGKQRFCIDFRNLNKVTIRDVYPIPRIDDCLTALGGNQHSTFDFSTFENLVLNIRHARWFLADRHGGRR